jgi:N-acetylgalactosamine-6-sulfatase
VDDKSIVSAVDLLPTFCSQAGIALPDGYRSDGQDMSRVFWGQTVARERPLFWDWTGIQAGHTSNMSPGLAVRSGKWKFLMNPGGSRQELYDFEADPQCMELDNVADRYPDEVKRFSKMLREFKASIPQGVPQQGNGSNAYPMPGAKD